MENQTIKELTSFIKNSPTAFHAVKSIRDILTKEGFQELKESEKWKIEKGGKYYVTRNHSSILAFKVGNQLDEYSFIDCAVHMDCKAWNHQKISFYLNQSGLHSTFRLYNHAPCYR